MKNLIFLAAMAVVTLMMSSPGQATDVTGCLRIANGELYNVQVGPVPSGRCGPRDSIIQWNQVGPAGADGADGTGGAAALQLTRSTTLTDGFITTAEWNDSCAALGGRAASTKDLLTLPWANSFDGDGEPRSWVRPYIVATTDSGDAVIDVTGIQGTLADLTCGTPRTPSTGFRTTIWNVPAAGANGLIAFRGSAAAASCIPSRSVTCVVPIP